MTFALAKSLVMVGGVLAWSIVTAQAGLAAVALTGLTLLTRSSVLVAV